MTRVVMGREVELVRRGPAVAYDVYVAGHWIGGVVFTHHGAWHTEPEREDAPVIHTGALRLALASLVVEEGL